MSDTLKLAIIGAGAITQVAHLPVLRKLKGVQIVGICDTDLPKAKALADRFQVRDAFSDIEEILEFEQLDAVAICTPNHLHEPHVQAALSRGVHVLVERPLALSAAGVQKILRLAEKKNRILHVGMNHRYRSDVQIVRSYVQSGELGKLESIRGSWHVFRPSRAQLGWRQRREEAGGGAMLDLGHAILDLGFWLAGSPTPVRVSASLTGGDGNRGVEQSGSAFVVCEGGFSMFLDVTWHHVGEGERFGLGLRGSKGTAGINPFHVWKELHGVPTDVAPTGAIGRENAFTASYRAEWAHFLAALRGEAKPFDNQEQLVLHRVIDAIYESAAKGKDVEL
ncbi:MAG: Gfo/Idh/MocA family oxidoreductase [Gemmatimonadetes bacterium]|nr:Gfo/Idh/MocA family oxidoreductase [Gemmatimonadota bacterium]MBK6778644.1 Gfo/Idh/MocA family oxidoreductase [Gemmatimonadota bacterium]MBK7349047.1 Gfo/Idh/MocA family oxidoreductase [Gemmatimonadota bacterium]MBK7714609.1 Gfo/Idh/MocA family oxidoreductase [Gemmatimonadota bacterium]MBK7783676.1 Gfo/Idh/MocA family oxidoreductase [Gemmatimonadota bacterium]